MDIDNESVKNHGILLSLAERIPLADLARSGDLEARERLILAFLRFCDALAYQYSEYYASTSYSVEKEDLFQIAVLTVMQILDQAMKKYADPFPYVFLSVRREIIEHCLWRIHLIVPPQTRNCAGGARHKPYPIGSIERVGNVRMPDTVPEEQAYPALYQAIEHLQGRYRLVVEMRFGLNGYAPTSFPMMDKVLAEGRGTPSSRMASGYLVKALRKLRKLLESSNQ